MPSKSTSSKAHSDKRAGKSSSTQAGEYVREEMHHIREGKHGARSAKQAIAIGLSKARRAGVKAKPGKSASPETRKKAEHDIAKGQKSPSKKPSRTRSRATSKALKREGHSAASHRALSRHGRSAAAKRTASDRSGSARKAAGSRTAAQRSASARKGAETRRRNRAKGRSSARQSSSS